MRSDVINHVESSTLGVLISTDDGLFRMFNGVLSEIDLSSLSLQNKKINTTLVSGNDLWVGTDGSGLLWYDGVQWNKYVMQNSPIPSNRIRSLIYDSVRNFVWVGTYSGGGLCNFNKVNWQVFTPANSGLPNNSVAAISMSQSGNILVGTASGVSEFDGSITWNHWNLMNSPLPNNSIFDIQPDGNNNYWIATNAGLVQTDFNDWTVYNVANESVHSNLIRTIAHQGNIVYIGTETGGISMYSNGIWRSFINESTNLPNQINSICIDQMGKKWIGTNTGLFLMP